MAKSIEVKLYKSEAHSISLGYNFPSLEAITPFLEETTAGTTTRWAQSTARRLGCCVTVGYPEVTSSTPARRYNSTVTVARNGSVLVNYRKTFLYYTDETWASEGEPRFFVGQLGELGLVAHGICMDINPYKFVAPWTEYEFAMRALGSSTPLIGLSMAWLTRLAPEELVMAPLEPDMETLTYWLERFHPFIERARPEPVIIVIANRCGREGDVCYAGSSAVVSIQRGEVRVHGLLGRFEEALLFVDSSSVSRSVHIVKGSLTRISRLNTDSSSRDRTEGAQSREIDHAGKNSRLYYWKHDCGHCDSSTSGF